MVRAKKGQNLAKANLSGLNLRGITLRKANLSKADLSEADLSKADLSEANLSKADLYRANFRMAKLRDANLRECNLRSANFEDADLSGADLTGVNIWNIATADWKIDGVKCDYAYNYKLLWNKEEKERTRRNFAPGEFEQIYKSFPRFELIFKEEFSHLDHRALLAVIDRINQELPTANLHLHKIERTGQDTTATLSAETKEAVEKVADILPEQYTRILAEFARIPAGQAEIKTLLANPKPLAFEMAFFEKHKKELLKKYEGKYVAIKRDEVICNKNTEGEIIEEIYGKGAVIKGKFVEGNKVGDVFVEKVTKGKPKRYIFKARK
ncbi:MAG: pentapeptide repeat-containing protein [Candidatus Brocadiales bacterium]